MQVVLADGSLQTIDANSDLWWAMKGAGHNFGIVTSLSTKIYDIQHSNWAINTLIFSGDKVEAVYQATNDYLLKNGTQAADVINWSYWLNIPSVDPNNVST
jgi:predicted phosphoadenosine phosphosulfate sulfurtransferase